MARPKRFGLETLLRIRKRQEELRAMSVAVAQRDIRLAEEQRTQLLDEQRLAMERWSLDLRQDLDVSDARRYHQYERHLAHLIDERDATIRRLEMTAVAKRAELLEASKKKRIAEKLKERKNAAFERELTRLEQRASDETGTNHAAIARQRDAHANDAAKTRG